jgi:hypothetical protein
MFRKQFRTQVDTQDIHPFALILRERKRGKNKKKDIDNDICQSAGVVVRLLYRVQHVKGRGADRIKHRPKFEYPW